MNENIAYFQGCNTTPRQHNLCLKTAGMDKLLYHHWYDILGPLILSPDIWVWPFFKDIVYQDHPDSLYDLGQGSVIPFRYNEHEMCRHVLNKLQSRLDVRREDMGHSEYTV